VERGWRTWTCHNAQAGPSAAATGAIRSMPICRGGGLREGTKPWTSVYLVEYPDDDDVTKVVRRHFAEMFEEQLQSWHLVVDDWPAPRTFAMFQKWFEVDVAEPVFDLSDRPIEPDE
jgi:hypothetical protein